jgi:phenylacetate-CoA ligase
MGTTAAARKRRPVKPAAAPARRLNSRERWIAVLEKYLAAMKGPRSKRIWAPEYEACSRSRLEDIQNEKLAAMLPYLYDNSPFFKKKFRSARLTPKDIRSSKDLYKLPVTSKTEMAEDVSRNAPWGTYTPINDSIWAKRAWMVFCTSGTTVTPRSFRYTALDRKLWEVTSGRAVYAMGVRAGDCALTCTTYNPHVYFWSIHSAFNLMGVCVVPGGTATERRVQMINSYRPSILVATPSYALHLAEAMRRQGLDPAASSVKRIICGGEPASGIPSSRHRIEDNWNADLHDVYGCTEALPAGWAFTCEEGIDSRPVSTHVQEDLQIWEIVDPDTMEPVSPGQRGLTVVTNLNSEGSPQLRFLVGDFAVMDSSRCKCGRTFARALGGFAGRADDMLNIRGLKLFPSVIEEIVRGFEECGDEFQIVLTTEGVMDEVTIVAESDLTSETAGAEKLRARIMSEMIARCELRPKVELVAPGTLPKTEFKARRVVDRRQPL